MTNDTSTATDAVKIELRGPDGKVKQEGETK